MYREEHYPDYTDKSLKVVLRYDAQKPMEVRCSILQPWALNPDIYITTYFEVYNNIMSLTTRDIVKIIVGRESVKTQRASRGNI